MTRAIALWMLMACAAMAQQSITLPKELVDPGASSAPTQTLPGGTATVPATPAAPPPMLAAPGQPAQAEGVDIQVVAFKGSDTGSASITMDEELKPLKEMLETLAPNDSFELIADPKQRVPTGQEVRFTVNGIYTAYVKLNGTRQAPEGGQLYDIEVRVEMLEGNSYVNALRARGEAAPNEALALRGMDLDIGELIVLVIVSPDGQDQNQGGQGDEQSQAENQEEQEEKSPEEQQAEKQEQEEKELKQEQAKKDEEKKNEDGKKDEGEGEAESAKPELAEQGNEAEQEPEGEQSEMAQQGEDQKSDAESGESKDMETIEAILQNLEEKDRQEQKNARYRRSQVIIRGDWW